MHLVEKLQSFRRKASSTTALNKEFGGLIGIELYDFIQENDPLKNEFDKRLHYLENLANNPTFILLQDKLSESVINILKCTSLQKVEEFQKIRGGQSFVRIKNSNPDKDFLTLPEIYLLLTKKENYYRLGDKASFSPHEGDIAGTHPTAFVKKQFKLAESLFELIGINIIAKDEKLMEKYQQKIDAYNEVWYTFLEQIEAVPVKLHVKDFQEFAHFCLAAHPRKGHELYYEMSHQSLYRNDGHYKLDEVKKASNTVIEDLIECTTSRAESPEKTKKAPTQLYLNAVGDLWRNPKEKYCYSMEEGSDRHKIVRYLASHKGYQQTREISASLIGKSERSVRQGIAKVNENFAEFIKMKDKFIESKIGSGYKINSVYTVQILK